MEFMEYTTRNARRQVSARYRCDCGSLFEALEYNVKTGHTKSCGCKKRALVSAARSRHLESRPKSFEYSVWAGIKSRCLDAKCWQYRRYGGRGIKVHPAWAASFEAFLGAVGRRPSAKHSIDRIDNDGHYEPGNVRWATAREQARNRRNNRVIEFGGRRQCLRAWADELGISPTALLERLIAWPIERALTTANLRAA